VELLHHIVYQVLHDVTAGR